MNKLHISILGGGWIGVPLAETLVAKGYSVQMSQSSQSSLIQNKEIRLLSWRAEPHMSDQSWQPMLDADILIWTIPPRRKEYGDTFYLEIITDFIRLANKRKYQKIIFLSSTSVYKSVHGVVDEQSEVEDNMMSQAEKIFMELQSPWLILRLGGLMGGNRFVAKYYSGKTIPAANHPVNYVHRVDVLEIIFQSLFPSIIGIYNVVAPFHPIKSELVFKECEMRNLPKPQGSIEDAEPAKIVSSDKIIGALKYTFQYPDPLWFPLEN